MPAIITFLLKVLAKLDTEKINEHNRVIEYIDGVLEKFNVIINYEKYSNNELDYAHKELRVIHDNILYAIGTMLNAQKLDRIKLSIMSGRVYYHLVRYSKVSDEDTIKDYEERLKRYINNPYSTEEFRQNSFEKFIKYIVKDGELVSDDQKNTILMKVKEVCMEDMARINTIKDEFKSKLVYLVPLK